MQNTAATSKVVRVRRIVARKARVALLAALVAAGLVLPVILAGLVAPPAHAATTTPHFVVDSTPDWNDLDTSICSSKTVSGTTTVKGTLNSHP